MKLIVSCFLTIAVSNIWAASINTPVPTEDFGEAMKSYFEKVKQAMPCGIAGQPPMTPFTRQFVPISLKTEDIE